MNDKLHTELKKKYAGQLSSKFMAELAERLSANVENDDDIQNVLTGLDASPISIRDIQAESDRRVRDMQAKINELEARTPPPIDPPTPPPAASPEIAAMMQKLDALEKREYSREARALLHERAKAKGIPEVLFDTVQVESASQVDEIVNALQDKAQAIKQQFIQAGLVGEPPKKPTVGGANSNQVADEIKHLSVKIT